MAQVSDLHADLNKVANDAAAARSAPSDAQTGNRLHHDVMDFMRDHQSPQDKALLTKVLQNRGLSDDQITSLEKLGFPTPSISGAEQHPAASAKNSGGEHSNHGGDAHAQTPAGHREAGEQPKPEQPKPPQTAQDVVNEVGQAERNFDASKTDGTIPQAQKGLEKALQDVRDFIKQHPDQAHKLISDLGENGYMAQLSLVALNEKTRNLSVDDTLTRSQAVSMVNDGTPLGKALGKTMDRSFSYIQSDGSVPKGYFGHGWADNRDLRSSEPNLSMFHLRQDLMTHLERAPISIDYDDDGNSSWIHRVEKAIGL
jgi:hypothetical protein